MSTLLTVLTFKKKNSFFNKIGIKYQSIDTKSTKSHLKSRKILQQFQKFKTRLSYFEKP